MEHIVEYRTSACVDISGPGDALPVPMLRNPCQRAPLKVRLVIQAAYKREMDPFSLFFTDLTCFWVSIANKNVIHLLSTNIMEELSLIQEQRRLQKHFSGHLRGALLTSAPSCTLRSKHRPRSSQSIKERSGNK